MLKALILQGRGKLVLLSIVLALVTVALGCDHSDQVYPNLEILTPQERAWLQALDRPIRIGPDPNFPPFEFFNDEGVYQGVVQEYVRRIEKILNIRVEVVRKGHWEDVVKAYESREVDVVPAMTFTTKRQEYMLFTEPYIEVPTVIVGRKKESSSIELSDLSNARVLVLEGYAVQEYLKQNLSHIATTPVPDARTGLLMVFEGKADYFVVYQDVYKYMQEKLGLTGLHIVGNTNHLVRLAFASRNDWPELNSILSKALASISPAERAEIATKWTIAPQGWFRMNWVIWTVILGILGTIVLIVIFVFVWNRLLRILVNQRTNELRHARDYLSELFNSIPTVMIGVGPEGNIVRVNAACKRLLPFAGDSFFGKPYWVVFPFLEQELVNSIVETDGSATAPNAFAKRISVEDKVFEVQAFVIKAKGHEGLLISLDDITELEKVQQMVRHAQRMEIIGTMVSCLAHDFNNYLTTLTGGLYLLDNKIRALPQCDRTPFTTITDMMNSAVSQAAELVKRLLSFGRSGTTAAVKVDLNSVVERSMAMGRASLADGIVVEMKLSPGLAVVFADPLQLEQVLLNLIINAGHAMSSMKEPPEKPHGKLTVSVSKSEGDVRALLDVNNSALCGWWLIQVSDTGVGMDEKTKEKVFDPFFSTKPRGIGSGLGLTTAYSIVLKQGGVMTVQSELGIGSTFSVYLPSVDPD